MSRLDGPAIETIYLDIPDWYYLIIPIKTYTQRLVYVLYTFRNDAVDQIWPLNFFDILIHKYSP